MLDARFRPLPKWTEKTALLYKRPKFRKNFNAVLDHLEYELSRLAAYDIVVEGGFGFEQIRNDGWPRSGQNPSHPGIILYFRGAEGQMRFPCGTYESWEDNLYAIALTLENLRAIDRYGVTLGHEQYQGFLALPPAPAKLTIEDAAAFLSLYTGWEKSAIIVDPDVYRTAYKRVAQKLHPDVAGGSADAFAKLGEAKRLLDEHHQKKGVA